MASAGCLQNESGCVVEEWVYISHAEIPIDPAVEPARVTREALDTVWSELGWTETTWTDPMADVPVTAPAQEG